jgi:hypothetical protein
LFTSKGDKLVCVSGGKVMTQFSVNTENRLPRISQSKLEQGDGILATEIIDENVCFAINSAGFLTKADGSDRLNCRRMKMTILSNCSMIVSRMLAASRMNKEIVGGKRNSLAILGRSERVIRKLEEEQRKRQGGFEYWIPHRGDERTQKNRE